MLLLQDVLVGLRSAVETVAGAEGLPPAQAPVLLGAPASAQPAAQAASGHQGSATDGRDPRYAYTWAVILAAVSSTVSCALLLATLLALGLGRRWRPAGRRAPGEAAAGAAQATTKPPGGGGGPPGVLLRCKTSRGSYPDQRRWASKPMPTVPVV